MRQIKIDNSLKSSVKQFIDKELSNNSSLFSKAKLKIENYYCKNNDEKFIIDHMLSDFGAFLCQTPKEQNEFILKWKSRNDKIFYNEAQKGTDKKTPFCYQILKDLNYNDLRKRYAIEISSFYKFNTCPYCNAMLTVNVKTIKGKAKARYQLDHFFPKSRYPYLSISIFNLISSCSNCNLSKTNKDIVFGDNFHPLSENDPVDVFKFTLKDADKIKLISNLPLDKIDLDFTSFVSNKLAETHNANFDIIGVYDTQKDIVLDLVFKYQAYHHSKLGEIGKLLNLKDVLAQQLIIGNYINKEDIHKRPMSKFMQDIAKDLGLL